MRDETKLKNLKQVDFRIGERLYTFNSFDDGCKAIAIHSRFIGYQNDLEKRLRDEGIYFKHSNLESPSTNPKISRLNSLAYVISVAHSPTKNNYK